MTSLAWTGTPGGARIGRAAGAGGAPPGNVAPRSRLPRGARAGGSCALGLVPAGAAFPLGDLNKHRELVSSRLLLDGESKSVLIPTAVLETVNVL